MYRDKRTSVYLMIILLLLLIGSIFSQSHSYYTFERVQELNNAADMNSTKITDATNLNIVNSSSIVTNNTNRPSAVGSVDVENLNKPPILNILVLLHPKPLPAPIQQNSAATMTLKNEAAHNALGTSYVSYLHETRVANKFSTVFDGLNISQSGGYFPADVQLAVGQRHILEMVNLAGQTWLKRGPSSNQFALHQFFKTGSDTISSPRVIYDNGTGRWFAAIQDITTESIHLAVSTTDDPRGNWTIYKFPFSDCPDSPGIAISNDKLVISVNDFTNHCGGGTFSGAQYTVVDKNDLLTGYPTPRLWQSKADPNDFSVHPVYLPGTNSDSDLYMVSTGSLESNSVKLYTISGKVPLIKINVTDIPIHQIRIPPQAPQPNSTIPLDTGDSRVLDAAMYKGKLWFTAADACIPALDNITRSCFVLVQIDVKNNRIIQDFDVVIPGAYTHHPALSIDASGNLDVIYGVVSDKFYPSLYVSGQNLNGPLNTLNQPVDLVIGVAPNKSGRFGGYILANDPSNPLQLWVAGEYNNPTLRGPFQWSTFIGNYITSSSPRNISSSSP